MRILVKRRRKGYLLLRSLKLKQKTNLPFFWENSVAFLYRQPGIWLRNKFWLVPSLYTSTPHARHPNNLFPKKKVMLLVLVMERCKKAMESKRATFKSHLRINGVILGCGFLRSRWARGGPGRTLFLRRAWGDPGPFQCLWLLLSPANSAVQSNSTLDKEMPKAEAFYYSNIYMFESIYIFFVSPRVKTTKTMLFALKRW